MVQYGNEGKATPYLQRSYDLGQFMAVNGAPLERHHAAKHLFFKTVSVNAFMHLTRLSLWQAENVLESKTYTFEYAITMLHQFQVIYKQLARVMQETITVGSVAGGREDREVLNEFKSGISGYRSAIRQTSTKGSIASHL